MKTLFFLSTLIALYPSTVSLTCEFCFQLDHALSTYIENITTILLTPVALYISISFLEFYFPVHSTYLTLFYEFTFNDARHEDPEYYCSQTVGQDEGATKYVTISDGAISSIKADYTTIDKITSATTSPTHNKCIIESEGLGGTITQTKYTEEKRGTVDDENENVDSVETVEEDEFASKNVAISDGTISSTEISYSTMVKTTSTTKSSTYNNCIIKVGGLKNTIMQAREVEEKRDTVDENESADTTEMIWGKIMKTKVRKLNKFETLSQRLKSSYDETYVWQRGGLRRGGESLSDVEFNRKVEEFISKGKKQFS